MLPKKQAALAEYIVRNYKTAALLASIPLGEQAGVSEATVIRLAHSLGYEGFLQMSRELRRYVKDEINTIDKMRDLEDFYSDKSIFNEVLENSISMLSGMKLNISEADMKQAVQMVCRARRIFIAGFENAAGLAEYIGYNLVRIRPFVSVISSSSHNMLNAVKTADEDTLAFILTFPRYARESVTLSSTLHRKGTQIIGVTDSVLSPIREFCDLSFTLPLRQQTTPYLDASIAVITLFQILFFLYGKENPDSVRENLAETEEYNRYFKIFHSAD